MFAVVIGCGDQAKSDPYIDENNVPRYKNTEEMGKHYPHINIEGQKVDYDVDIKWYFYKDTRIPAMWLEVGGSLTEVPDRVLYRTGRKMPDGSYEQYFDGKWQKAKPPKQEKLPPITDSNFT